MKRLVMLILIVLVVSGCDMQAETSTHAGIGARVDKLFTVDGCTVYRFEDAGMNRYFTNCHGSTEWTESCGKNCTTDQGVAGGTP